MSDTRLEARRRALMSGAAFVLLALVFAYFIFSRRPPQQGLSQVLPIVQAQNGSLAIWPLENLSDPADVDFAGGIQAGILTRLSKTAGLKVLWPRAAPRYQSAPENLPQIAKQFGVTYILEGSARRTVDRIRLSVKLSDAANDRPLWFETYDRELPDTSAAESEIAARIAEVLLETPK